MEDHTLDHLKWAAWGVIDIEKLERMQRRNYIKKVRAELGPHGVKLECGGSTRVPYYRVHNESTSVTQFAAGGDAFKRVCLAVLEKLEPGSKQEDAA